MPINNAAINSLLRKAKAEGKDGKPVSEGTVPGLVLLPRKTGNGTWYWPYSFGVQLHFGPITAHFSVMGPPYS